MVAPRVLLAISVVLWGALALMGVGGLQSIRDQHVAGYPNAGQIHYYLVIPLVASGLSLALLGLTWFRRFGCALSAVAILLILSILQYLFYYTGGV